MAAAGGAGSAGRREDKPGGDGHPLTSTRRLCETAMRTKDALPGIIWGGRRSLFHRLFAPRHKERERESFIINGNERGKKKINERFIINGNEGKKEKK